MEKTDKTMFELIATFYLSMALGYSVIGFIFKNSLENKVNNEIKVSSENPYINPFEYAKKYGWPKLP